MKNILTSGSQNLTRKSTPKNTIKEGDRIVYIGKATSELNSGIVGTCEILHKGKRILEFLADGDPVMAHVGFTSGFIHYEDKLHYDLLKWNSHEKCETEFTQIVIKKILRNHFKGEFKMRGTANSFQMDVSYSGDSPANVIMKVENFLGTKLLPNEIITIL